MTFPPAKPLWTGLELLAALGARAHRGLPDAVSGASIDTRTLAPGDLFFAIRGDSRDGHDFVARAFAAGAPAAVVDEAHAPALGVTGPLFIVPDVLAALTAVGAAARASASARVVAVTGSVGKTSTKEALKLALSSQGPTHASAASYNNHWGVPLSLARMARDSAYGIFEIGMSAPGEIMPLSALVRPHVAIVTAIAPVHLEFFPSVEAIADAKAEIFVGIEPGGAAVINRDSTHFERLQAHAAASAAGRIIGFGEHDGADVRLVRVVAKPEMSRVEAEVFGRRVRYRLGAPGRHLVLNSLAVLGAVHALGGDLGAAMARLGELAPAAGRGRRSAHVIKGGSFLLIDESYNANPASMTAALDMLGEAPAGWRGRRVAVLADMLELGPQGPALHGAIAETIAANGIDLVFAAGPLMAHLWEALPPQRRGAYGRTPAEILTGLVETLRPGDTVMVKGSNSTRVATLVAALKSAFPAAEMADAVGA